MLSQPGWTQESLKTDASIRDLIEVEQQSDKILEAVEKSGSNGAGDESTPLKTLAALRQALDDRDYQRAGEFLDMRYLPDDVEIYSGDQLMRALVHIFKQQNIINLAQVSDLPEGDLNDDLPGYRDQIGTVTLVEETIPIYLQRIPDGQGGRVWKISNATVEQIPRMWEELGYSPIAIYLNEILPDFSFMGMDNWQLFATLIIVIIAWPLATLVSSLLLKLALAIYDSFPIATANFFRGPLRFFLFILITRLLISQLGLSLTARIVLESSGVRYIAYTVLLLGLLSFIRDYQIRKMQRAGNMQYVALLKPFTTIIKVIVVTIIAVFWADSAGYNMSTVLAGLGVGSLAVALAAQKTMENVIGAVTLYTARPVKAGDFCRFGNVTGTVEEIGLRSTIIRTLDRTLVVIPNAVFSSTEIENYSARDRIRYYRRYRLQLAGAGQMRLILSQIRAFLAAQPGILPETISVRFETIEDGTAWLRLDAGVDTTDYQEFLAVAETINLRLVEIAEDAGATFSGPGTLLQGDTAHSRRYSVRAIEASPDSGPDSDSLPSHHRGDNHEEEPAGPETGLDTPPSGAKA
jgi:MscS family membrane protein